MDDISQDPNEIVISTSAAAAAPDETTPPPETATTTQTTTASEETAEEKPVIENADAPSDDVDRRQVTNAEAESEAVVAATTTDIPTTTTTSTVTVTSEKDLDVEVSDHNEAAGVVSNEAPAPTAAAATPEAAEVELKRASDGDVSMEEEETIATETTTTTTTVEAEAKSAADETLAVDEEVAVENHQAEAAVATATTTPTAMMVEEPEEPKPAEPKPEPSKSTTTTTTVPVPAVKVAQPPPAPPVPQSTAANHVVAKTTSTTPTIPQPAVNILTNSANKTQTAYLSHNGRIRKVAASNVVFKEENIQTYTDANGVIYKIADHVYMDTNKPNQPFAIGCILDFKMTRKESVMIEVRWYFRPNEIPDGVYVPLMQDRFIEDKNVADELSVLESIIKGRELFASDCRDIYPSSFIKGKCRVFHYQDILEAKDFKPFADTFFSIFTYNPEARRLANTQGEIRVGLSHQAKLPPLLVVAAETTGGLGNFEAEDAELLKWETPTWKWSRIDEASLLTYLQAARSIAAFAGMCDRGNADDMYEAAQSDSTTLNAIAVLHESEYDTERALQMLVEAPVPPRTLDKTWNEEDQKKFVKGLRQYGKNFFRIRKELLPERQTGELVEYYYMWKKTPAAQNSRPRRRFRPASTTNINKKTSSSSSSAISSSNKKSSSSAAGGGGGGNGVNGDSGGSDCESDNDSDESSENKQTSANSQKCCNNCATKVSKDWQNGGRDNKLLCYDCRMYYKKYGELPQITTPTKSLSSQNQMCQKVLNAKQVNSVINSGCGDSASAKATAAVAENMNESAIDDMVRKNERKSAFSKPETLGSGDHESKKMKREETTTTDEATTTTTTTTLEPGEKPPISFSRNSAFSINNIVSGRGELKREPGSDQDAAASASPFKPKALKSERVCDFKPIAPDCNSFSPKQQPQQPLIPSSPKPMSEPRMATPSRGKSPAFNPLAGPFPPPPGNLTPAQIAELSALFGMPPNPAMFPFLPFMQNAGAGGQNPFDPSVLATFHKMLQQQQQQPGKQSQSPVPPPSLTPSSESALNTSSCSPRSDNGDNPAYYPDFLPSKPCNLSVPRPIETLKPDSNAMFVKVWDRGANMCSRTDFIFKYLPNAKYLQSRQEAAALKAAQQQQQQQAKSPSLPHSFSQSSLASSGSASSSSKPKPADKAPMNPMSNKFAPGPQQQQPPKSAAGGHHIPPSMSPSFAGFNPLNSNNHLSHGPPQASSMFPQGSASPSSSRSFIESPSALKQLRDLADKSNGGGGGGGFGGAMDPNQFLKSFLEEQQMIKNANSMVAAAAAASAASQKPGGGFGGPANNNFDLGLLQHLQALSPHLPPMTPELLNNPDFLMSLLAFGKPPGMPPGMPPGGKPGGGGGGGQSSQQQPGKSQPSSTPPVHHNGGQSNSNNNQQHIKKNHSYSNDLSQLDKANKLMAAQAQAQQQQQQQQQQRNHASPGLNFSNGGPNFDMKNFAYLMNSPSGNAKGLQGQKEPPAKSSQMPMPHNFQNMFPSSPSPLNSNNMKGGNSGGGQMVNGQLHHRPGMATTPVLGPNGMPLSSPSAKSTPGQHQQQQQARSGLDSFLAAQQQFNKQQGLPPNFMLPPELNSFLDPMKLAGLPPEQIHAHLQAQSKLQSQQMMQQQHQKYVQEEMERMLKIQQQQQHQQQQQQQQHSQNKQQQQHQQLHSPSPSSIKQFQQQQQQMMFGQQMPGGGNIDMNLLLSQHQAAANQQQINQLTAQLQHAQAQAAAHSAAQNNNPFPGFNDFQQFAKSMGAGLPPGLFPGMPPIPPEMLNDKEMFRLLQLHQQQQQQQQRFPSMP